MHVFKNHSNGNININRYLKTLQRLTVKLLGGKGRKVEMLQHFYENFPVFLDPHKLQHCNKDVGEKNKTNNFFLQSCCFVFTLPVKGLLQSSTKLFAIPTTDGRLCRACLASHSQQSKPRRHHFATSPRQSLPAQE